MNGALMLTLIDLDLQLDLFADGELHSLRGRQLAMSCQRDGKSTMRIPSTCKGCAATT
ncbi:hypothetical protein DEDE109153_02510 [Deinococcus deserti]